MPEPKRPLKVFLCRAHADRDPVRGLYARLTQDGVDAWLDKAKLLPGQDWELEIRKAVREADVAVVCLSKQFNQAGFRQKEVRLALDTAMEKPESEIFIVPARLEECDTPESMRKWHWVDMYEDGGYEMLMRALRVRADKVDAVLKIKKSRQLKVAVLPKPDDTMVEKARVEKKKETLVFAMPENIKLDHQKTQSSHKLNWLVVITLISLIGICLGGLNIFNIIPSQSILFRVNDVNGDAISQAKVILLSGNDVLLKYTDSSGFVSFTVKTTKDIRVFVETSQYDIYDSIIGHDMPNFMEITLVTKDISKGSAIVVRLINAENNMPISSASITLVTNGKVYATSSDLYGIIKFIEAFPTDELDGDISISFSDYKTEHQRITLQKDRVQDINLNKSTGVLTVNNLGFQTQLPNTPVP